ncbi:acyl-CoA dehydrogenase family protein [Parafrankia sp. EUN1f]|uniref:acyl-CoA dehydrogenase family protein n=1 Tax=Parafrankia sp. EUN1f TaxID=102897 RepID=UPI0001C470BE|nr:acyl-CoA dehydrogenase family protein [Parafrankia sp. EUN1f]EFC80145.1 acyl-CoA dehydrogenase domain protein [Parafrankia sp. EUN1f]
MRFALSDEQRELARAVRQLVDRRAAALGTRAAAASDLGYDDILWKTLCTQIGGAALAIPQEYGGAGATLLESHVILEQLGVTLTPSPYLGSAILATQAVLGAAGPEHRERLLPALADGTVGALAWADGTGRWRTDGAGVRAAPAGGDIGSSDRGWRLSGRSTLVLDGSHAEILLAVAETPDGLGLFEVDQTSPGVTRTRVRALDLSLDLATVAFDQVPAVALACEDVGPALRRLHAVAATAVTALQVGGAQRALDRTVGHLRARVQFGRPLGSFQALKHRAADMFVAVETARSMSWAAGWAAAHDPADLPLRAALAKAWCSEAFAAVAGESIQLHGGIAITWEDDTQLYFKRAHATGQLFGQAHEHRKLLLDDPR